jgi:6-pyruvoyltetrahydropterin/6-carboxytetrahydropterin synthase
MYEVTICREFSAAHAIRLYDGTLEPVHGHNWSVRVTVGADKLDEIGVVMDFHLLEQSVDRLIETVHNRNLNDVSPFADGAVNPTAEQVAHWLGDRVAAQLPAAVRLRLVEVGEAPGCLATYRPLEG